MCLRESYNGATTGNPLKGHTTGHNNRVTQNVGHMSLEGLLGICMHKAIGFEYFKFIFENFVFFLKFCFSFLALNHFKHIEYTYQAHQNQKKKKIEKNESIFFLILFWV